MSIGFIVLRHVNNALSNTYWQHSYDCIRKYYPDNHILIIDDNSNPEFLTHKELHNTTIINSEYKGRGELLPYYYYLKNKLFDTAVILHDSVFINKYIDFTVENYKIIWSFKHHWDQIQDETQMINDFNDPELLTFYNNKLLWHGCFGGMSIITHDFLTKINKKYDLSKLLKHITTRYNRCSFERVIGCLLQKEAAAPVLFGDIHDYCPWGIRKCSLEKVMHLPLIKVWSGR
jgi:hypothetical protein